MQRELVLDTDKGVADALASAVGAMVDEARGQARRALDEPGAAVHDYRRALRRAEAVVALAWPMLRKGPRRSLAKSFHRARRRTRIARDLDAVLPLIGKLEELALFETGDPALAGLRAWLEGCRGELASDEIVAWRLRKNVRALAGVSEIFQSAIHAWADVELVLESLRTSYRAARRAWRQADKSRKNTDVHALRQAVRRLRYQLELLASVKPSAPAPSAPIEPSAPEPAVESEACEPAWRATVVSTHATMKALLNELGTVTDLMALSAIVDEADAETGGRTGHLWAVLSELTRGRVEAAMAHAARAFVTPAKRFLRPPEPAETSDTTSAPTEDHATTRA